MITDDATLVNMVLGGNREAFDELVKKHRAGVLRLVLTCKSSRHMQHAGFGKRVSRNNCGGFMQLGTRELESFSWMTAEVRLACIDCG